MKGRMQRSMTTDALTADRMPGFARLCNAKADRRAGPLGNGGNRGQVKRLECDSPKRRFGVTRILTYRPADLGTQRTTYRGEASQWRLIPRDKPVSQ
jgi:hypothetical protein